MIRNGGKERQIMWTSSSRTELKDSRKRELLEKGYELLASRGIEPITMQDVADAVGCGIASVYRYFDKKPGFVIAVATWKWEQLRDETFSLWSGMDTEKKTAAELFEMHLDVFLDIYKKRRDVLRFNHFFNGYVMSEKVDPKLLEPYKEVIFSIRDWFHKIYAKAEEDHTIRTDESEEMIFSKTLHLMLAAVTRYAVGLVYIPETGFDPEGELEMLKEMLLDRYLT